MSNKEVVVPIGPYHPLQEEPEFFKLYCDGEVVKRVVWEAGYNHRGHEKISEGKSFDQSLFLVERICGICSCSHPFAMVNAVEDAGNITNIPVRAKYIRTILGELERIHSHLLWVGLAGHFIGYNTVFMWAWKYREPILDIFEMTCGNRNHYGMFKVGGVRRDIENDDIPEILKVLDKLKPKLNLLIGAVMDDPVIHSRTKGIGILTKEDIREFHALGPTARASGIPIDVRKDDPYAAYNMVKWKVITAEEGDVFAKAAVRLLEMIESVSIIEQCLNGLQKTKNGPIDIKLKEVPAGEGVGHHEAPRGEVFHFVKTNGTNSPERHKIRAPSLMNIPTFRRSCTNQTISDVALILAAVDPCYCCTERLLSVYDWESGKREWTFNDLVKLSHEKTRKIMKRLKKQDV
ncbi:MAG: nickel-dependent hydrogenase large subunit [Spirochaetes bacterium]|nr:nickel-dependent hydrogenase large subunit [Spirochaetota bacterium]